MVIAIDLFQLNIFHGTLHNIYTAWLLTKQFAPNSLQNIRIYFSYIL